MFYLFLSPLIIQHNSAKDAGDTKQLTLLGITALFLIQLQVLKNNLNHYSPLKTMFTI
jgi:hypothetical protein